MPAFDAAHEYAALRSAYREAEAVLRWPDERLFRVVPGVSGWSAAGYLYHVIRTNGLVYRTLGRLGRGGAAVDGVSAGAAGGGGLNRVGSLVLGTGRIQRGRGVAPELTHPPADLDRPTLEAAFARSREACEALGPAVPGFAALPGRLPHPLFGDLDAVEWLRFLHVHTAHHLAIVLDLAATDA